MEGKDGQCPRALLALLKVYVIPWLYPFSTRRIEKAFLSVLAHTRTPCMLCGSPSPPDQEDGPKAD